MRISSQCNADVFYKKFVKMHVYYLCSGAGEMMHEALRVNPYEIQNVADVLNRALTMPEDEREARMNALRKRERVNDVDKWTRGFLKNIGILIEEDGEDVLPTTMVNSKT